MEGPWARIVKLCDAKLKKLKKAYDTDAQIATGGPGARYAKWNVFPTNMYGAQWKGSKKQRKGVTANDLVIPEEKMKPGRHVAAPLMLSLDHKNPALALHPILMKGYKFKPGKAVNEMSDFERKQEVMSLKWALESAASMTAPPMKQITKIKARMQELKDSYALKAMTLDVVNEWLIRREWEYSDAGDVVYKALPKATPDGAPKGRKPAQSKAAGVNPKTGKQKYNTTTPKTGKAPSKGPPQGQDEEKPEKHTPQSLCVALGCKPEQLQALAAKTGERKFTALLRKKYNAKVAASGFTDTDIADVHRELTTTNAT